MAIPLLCLSFFRLSFFSVLSVFSVFFSAAFTVLSTEAVAADCALDTSETTPTSTFDDSTNPSLGLEKSFPNSKMVVNFLMKGMRGDADANRDKKITVGELGDYVEQNVSDMAGMLDREQTPSLQTIDEQKVLISY